MWRRARYSDAEWESLRAGRKACCIKKPLKVPVQRTILEQSAFLEGYQTKQEDIRNQLVVTDIKTMLGKGFLKRIIHQWANHQ